MKLGVDLGGTNLRAALVGENGEILQMKTAKTEPERGAEELTRRMIETVKALDDWEKADFIGVGVPGAVGRDGLTMTLASNLAGMDGYPLARALEKGLDRRVRLENDANAACLGEALFGAGKGYDGVCYLTISTGIGGGYYENGRLLKGSRGLATEFGSVTVDINRAPRNDLPAGAIESEASGEAVTRRMNASSACRYHHAGEVFTAAMNGDKAAKAVQNGFIRDLAALMSNLACVLDPSVFVLGGGVLQSADAFWDALTAQYRAFAQETYALIPIQKAALSQPGLVGAAMLDKAN